MKSLTIGDIEVYYFRFSEYNEIVKSLHKLLYTPKVSLKIYLKMKLSALKDFILKKTAFSSLFAGVFCVLF